VNRRRPLAVYTDVAGENPAEGMQILSQAGFAVRLVPSSDPEEIARAAADADALLIGYARVDGRLLRRLPRLGMVATQSVGVDMVDLAVARERGIWVSNVPAMATEEVAAHALAMVLSLVRGLPFLDREVRKGRWPTEPEGLARPSALCLGVLGLGRIGRSLAAMAAPLVGRVVGHDPQLPPTAWPAGVEPSTLDELLAASDVVSLHLPLSDDTAGLLDRNRLRRMRRGAFLVNVSRGGLVDARALRDLLDEGHLGGAALDVLEQEPPPADDLLPIHPRVLVTPHVAYLSAASRRDYVTCQANNVVHWWRHGRPTDVVVPA